MAAWLGLIPPLLAVLFAGWCGNLLGGVTAPGSTAALVLLLAMVAALAGPARDPLRLGRAGRLLPLACWLAAAASAWMSPVPRASLEPVVLLPAYLCLPAAVARCWSDAAARRLGARAMAAAVGLVSLWALLGYQEGGAAGAGFLGLATGFPGLTPGLPGGGGGFLGLATGFPGLGAAAARASPFLPLGSTLTPLGHHTLLAVWLAMLLPLALLPLREPAPWRWLAAASGLLGIAAAVRVGHSLAGDWALSCEALAAAAWAAFAARARRLQAVSGAAAEPSRLGGTAGDGAGSRSLGRDPAARPLESHAGRHESAAGTSLGSNPGGGETDAGARSAVAGAAGTDAADADPAGGSDSRSTRAAPRLQRLAVALVLLGLALAAVEGQRLWHVAARKDTSALARATYLRAGWEGWLERPWLGWGPGSVPWTASWFLRPRPGVNPWGEAVGELHCLPVHLAYETGAVGLLAALGLGLGWARARWRERSTGADRWWLAAGCLGMAGAGISLLGTAALAVAALPFALAVAAGAALAGGAAERAADRRLAPGDVGGGGRGAGGLAACVYALVAAAALLAPELARWHYDRAVAADQAGGRRAAVAEMAAAVRLDPGFPLYRTRLAMLRDPAAPPSAPPGGDAGTAAVLALGGAREARGVGLLWLVAGLLGRADGEVWAPAAFEQSCALDPFSPYPPFYLLASAAPAPASAMSAGAAEPAGTPGSGAAGAAIARLGARALLAEPRLLAATWWEGREPLFRRSLEEVRTWPDVDAGWKLALLRAAPRPQDRRGAIVRLSLNVDTVGFTQATSLHLFRRLPWPAQWPLVALRQGLLPAPPLPPATSLAGTGRGRFDTRACLPGR